MVMIQDAPWAAYLADDPVSRPSAGRVVRQASFANTGARQRERNEQRSHRADGATVSRCARPVGVSKRQRTRVGRVTLQRMDNVGIVVESLDAAISFFAELGLELEGRATVEGDWAERVTGLGDQRVEIAMMRTPDGHSRLELSRFLTPPPVADHRNAPV